MKITLIAPGALPCKGYGGTERQVEWLAEELMGLGHAVVVIAGQVKGPAPFELRQASGDTRIRQAIPADTQIVHFHGAYLDIDVVWVRLAFVLLLFPTSGAWFLVWLVMLFIVPAARTPEQMAAARGESVSAREVVEMARRKSADIGKAAASGLRDVERNLRETFGPRN